MKMIKKLLMCGIALMTLMGFGAEPAALDDAGLNPRFLRWRKMKAAGKLPHQRKAAADTQSLTPNRRGSLVGDETADGVAGLAPDVASLGYLSDLVGGKNDTPVNGFPARFDLREKGQTTAARDQGSFETCWAFASLASLESAILVQRPQDQTYTAADIDFSERHMVENHGYDLPVQAGGSMLMSMAYLLRWGGPVSEAEAPYPAAGATDWIASGATAEPCLHVQQVRWLPGKTDYLENDVIKRHVMGFGGVYTTFRMEKQNYYNEATAAYYCPVSAAVNHGVTIIGWDDNYPCTNFKALVRPKADGAYLVKNSWGTAFGQDGCFWVSYYDRNFAVSPMAVFCGNESKANYATIYQYDELGYTGKSHSGNARNGKAWMANVFTAEEDDQIAAVGFYALAPKSQYMIRVYTDCTGDPATGTMRESNTQPGEVEYAGYVTIPLKKVVPVAKGQKFAVCVQLYSSRPVGAGPLAYEAPVPGYSTRATAAAGESFFSSNGTKWYDLSSSVRGANFCVKAYGIADEDESDHQDKVRPKELTVSGPSVVAAGARGTFETAILCDDNSTWSEVIAEYEILSGGAALSAVDAIGNAVTVTVRDDLAEETRVVLRLSAMDGISEMTVSREVAFTATRALPAVPDGLTATGGANAVEPGVRLAWNGSANAETYAVYRSETEDPRNAVFLVSVQGTRYTDITAVPGTDYTYFIKAQNGAGASAMSAGATGWRRLAPPADLVATDGDYDYVQLTWAAAEGARYYKVFRAADMDADGNPVEPVEVSDWIENLALQDTPPEKGQVYYYWVKSALSFTGYRASDWSIFDAGSRRAPVSLATVQILGPAGVSAGATATYTLAATMSDGARVEPVTNAVWRCSLGGDAVTGDRYAFTALVDGLLVASNTLVTITAEWTFANADGVSTKTDSKAVVIAPVVPVRPNAVKIVSATVDGVSVEWTAVEGAAFYRLYSGETLETATLLTTTDALSYDDTKVIPGATYRYWVEAVNAAGASEKSEASLGAMRQFTPPVYVTASNGTSVDDVQVTWRAVTGAKFYRVARADSSDGEKRDLSGWIAGRTFSDTTAAPGVTYWYFVQAAYDADGGSASAWSVATIGKVSPAQTLAFIEIDGPAFIQYDSQGSFVCVATYANGVQKRVNPVWSFKRPHELVSVGADGVVSAGHVTGEDLHLELQASYTDGGVTKSDSFAVTVLAAKSVEEKEVFVSNVVVRARWPWNGIVDVSYDLYSRPATTRAVVTLSGTDHDLRRTLDAVSVTGDGADRPAAGGAPHRDCRVSWNLGADYTNFHASAFSVALAAAPFDVAAPTEFRASDDTSTNAVELAWNEAFGAEYYEILRSPTNNRDDAELIASVTNATAFADTGAEPGETYYYWIRTISGEFETDRSEYAGPVAGKRARHYEKPSVDLQAGLAAYYPFNGDLDDASGNGHHLVFTTGDAPVSVAARAAAAGTAFRFADKTRLNATTNAPAVLSGDFTFAAWVRTTCVGTLRAEQKTGFNTGCNFLVHPAETAGITNGLARYGISVDRNGVNVFERAGDFLPAVLRCPAELGDDWHHVAFTVENNGAPVLYIDGVHAKTGIQTGRQKQLLVGENVAGGAFGSYAGDADDLCYYDRALARDEIAALFEAGSPLADGRPVSVPPTVDVAYGGGRATVTITCVEDGADTQPVVYYTIERADGGDTVDAREYTVPFTVEGNARVTAWSVKEGYYNSPRVKVEIKAAWRDTAHDTLAPGDTEGAVAFDTAGDADWVFDPNETSDAVNGSMRSGAVGAEGVSSMSATVRGAGQFAFDWKVSSEAGFDLLEVKVDGETAHRISGEVDWTELVLELTNDTAHVVTWTYAKDASVTRGRDCGWVDHITWAPVGSAVDAPVITATRFEGGASNLVTMACANIAGATIEAKVDLFGEPGEWVPYTGPFAVAGEATVYARAKKPGYIDSFPSKLEVKRDWVVRVTEALVTDDVTRGAVSFVPDYYEYGVDEAFWWDQDRAVVSDGSCASVRSPVIGDAAPGDWAGNGASVFAKVSGRGTLLFDWKVDSEAGWDVLTYYAGEEYVDYAYAEAISGDRDWARVKLVFSMDALHVIEWEYNKDDRGKAGRDCGWVDALKWIPARFTPAVPPTRPGYVFQGWATNENGAVVYPADMMLDAEDPNETFVAVWTPISYKVVYDAQPATSNAVTEQTFVYDEARTLQPAENFVFARGYTFAGWTTNDQNTVDFADGASVMNLATEQDAVVTLRPVLNPIRYRVRFLDEDGVTNVAADVYATFDVAFMLPTIPEMTNHFVECVWEFVTVTGRVYYAFGQEVKNLTLVADEVVELHLLRIFEILPEHQLPIEGGPAPFYPWHPFQWELDIQPYLGNLHVYTCTNAPWFAQTNTVKFGDSALRSGAIDHNQRSTLTATLTVTNRTRVSFWWKVSSEKNWDYLKFAVNGSVKASISGTDGDWEQVSVTLNEGSHTLEWFYSKDISISRGADCGWLDWLTIEDAPPVTIGTGGFQVVQYSISMQPSSESDALEAMERPDLWTAPPVTNFYSVLNFAENMQGGQNFEESAVAFPATVRDGKAPEYFVCDITGLIDIPTSGVWSFATGCYGYCYLDLTDENGAPHMHGGFYAFGRYGNTYDIGHLPEGRYRIRFLYYKHGDAAAFDLSCAKGSTASFNRSEFHLVGSPECEVRVMGND